MPGTSEDPVRLDPFQNIIEVGWPDNIPTHVAVPISIRRETVSVYGGDPGCSVTETLSAADVAANAYEPTWLSGLIYSLSGSPLTVSAYRPNAESPWNSGGTLTDEAEVSGVPDVSFSPSFGAWEHSGYNNDKTGGTFPPTAESLRVNILRHRNTQRWQSIAGSPVLDENGVAITVPGSDALFAATTAATYESRGIAHVETTPTCKEYDPGVLIPGGFKEFCVLAGAFPAIYDDLVDGASPVISGSELALNFSGVTVTIGENVYEAIGVAVPTSILADPVTKDTGAIYVLCALVEPTA